MLMPREFTSLLTGISFDLQVRVQASYGFTYEIVTVRHGPD